MSERAELILSHLGCVLIGMGLAIILWGRA